MKLSQKVPLSIVSLLTLFSSVVGWTLDSQIEALVKYETRSNAAAARSDDPVKIQNYEIPLRLLKANVADRIPPEVRASLIFQKNGESYVRWLINPEDTKWHPEVEKFLTENGISAAKESYFTGYMTASRSYILEDPITHVTFSSKVSTNKTGGNWTDKKQPIEDAMEVRLAADFVHSEQARAPFQDLIIMDEPAMFGIEAIDQAMLVRTLADLPKGGRTYIPGFSVLHDETGKAIAAKNGSDDPAEFWNEHYNKPLGKAVAEFVARTGLTYDSPHSQNFLVELDANMKPTGKIVLRDFGDTYAFSQFFKSSDENDFLKKWEPGNIMKTLHVPIGVLHGNQPPTWLSDSQYDQWGKDFYQAFEAEYSRVTGVPVDELQAKLTRSGYYFNKDYTPEGPGWKSYLSGLLSLHQQRLAVAAGKVHGKVSGLFGKCANIFGEPATQ